MSEAPVSPLASTAAAERLAAAEAALGLGGGAGPFVEWTLGAQGARRQITPRGHALIARLIDVLTTGAGTAEARS